MAAASIIMSVLLITPIGPTRPVEDPHHDQKVITRTIRAIEKEKAERKAETVAKGLVVEPVYSDGGSTLCDWSCIQCESGGDPYIFSSTGKYWGLYQFDYGTWVAHGGVPSQFGVAGPSVQHAVAAQVAYDAWPNC